LEHEKTIDLLLHNFFFITSSVLYYNTENSCIVKPSLCNSNTSVALCLNTSTQRYGEKRAALRIHAQSSSLCKTQIPLYPCLPTGRSVFNFLLLNYFLIHHFILRFVLQQINSFCILAHIHRYRLCCYCLLLQYFSFGTIQKQCSILFKSIYS
jgi:hypothetical protein